MELDFVAVLISIILAWGSTKQLLLCQFPPGTSDKNIITFEVKSVTSFYSRAEGSTR